MFCLKAAQEKDDFDSPYPVFVIGLAGLFAILESLRQNRRPSIAAHNTKMSTTTTTNQTVASTCSSMAGSRTSLRKSGIRTELEVEERARDLSTLHVNRRWRRQRSRKIREMTGVTSGCMPSTPTGYPYLRVGQRKPSS